MEKINILSLNIGMSSTLAGLTTLISSYNLHLMLLQEVRNTKEEIISFLGTSDYQAEVNIDLEVSSKPGTAQQ